MSNACGEGLSVFVCFSGLAWICSVISCMMQGGHKQQHRRRGVRERKAHRLSSQESCKLRVKNLDSVSDLNKHNSV